MPTFPAPGPVPIRVDVPFGNLRVVAGERDDVVVTVLPTDPAKSGSVRAAEEVRVQRDGEAVEITYPGSWKQWVLPFAAGTADVTVELPEGSDVRGKVGSFFAEGSLGTVELTASAGDARVEEVDRIDLKVSAGNAVVGRTVDAADLRVSAGSVRIDEFTGEGSVRATNGTVTVGDVIGSLDVTGAHAEIAVSRVRGTLTAKSAHSGIRVNNVVSGSVTLSTSYGSIEVGVPEGTAAFLDVASEHGAVRNQLTPAAAPVEGEATAEVHAHTGYGEIIIRRP
ncbi:DUF4097 family beta strand repeat-containing protein [Myceligenerans pegani]|uniref:DUF4097 family beta strand repeat protein n=1 Tax=Myceligenerans pegani TaxID=2776917 RepID=A0ABR9N3J9_9MICO|nr:DUF4097 family beta strand repeat-containing protein [Myceligenerans sp. TRM 65318]MBE1878239.1 DUF4097 family beta strand repeat protein [Myceligenerans sp. TRM 65318]MBE3020510.1 DUF4097 family beta strand repeat protein [Myceligenerans sp. TRM 65318]